MNIAETEEYETILIQNHIYPCHSFDQADVILIGSCGVVQTTEDKIISQIQEIQKSGKKIIVTGCLPGMIGKQLRKKFPEIYLFKSPQKDKFIEWIKNQSPLLRPLLRKEYQEKDDGFNIIGGSHEGFKRIAIQSGCLDNCTYCSTKIARPFLESKPIPIIMKEIREAYSLGYREFYLGGQDVCTYGLEGKENITNLLDCLIFSCPSDVRIRIGMTNPMATYPFINDLIRFFKNPIIYSFLHLPIQSGSERVLDNMKRGKTKNIYLEIIDRIRKEIPDLTLSTDIIVGFPGETIKDYSNTKELMEISKPDIINSHRYSKRKGTKATNMPDQLSTQEMKSRSKDFHEFRKNLLSKKLHKHINKKYKVMISQINTDGTRVGRTKNYLPVVINKSYELGKIYNVTIHRSTNQSLYSFTND